MESRFCFLGPLRFPTPNGQAGGNMHLATKDLVTGSCEDRNIPYDATS